MDFQRLTATRNITLAEPSDASSCSGGLSSRRSQLWMICGVPNVIIQRFHGWIFDPSGVALVESCFGQTHLRSILNADWQIAFVPSLPAVLGLIGPSALHTPPVARTRKHWMVRRFYVEVTIDSSKIPDSPPRIITSSQPPHRSNPYTIRQVLFNGNRLDNPIEELDL